MPASLESQLAVLRSQLDKYRDSDLPKVLQSPLAFDARKNLARDASQNRAFLALQEGLLGIITQLSALVVNASSPSQQELKDTLSAEAASLLDVLDGKRESDERSAVSTATTAAATGTAPRTPFFRRPTFTFVAPPRSTSRNTNANNADSSPHSASSASSQPQLDTGTQLALAASELDSLEPKLRSLSSRSLAFEILPGGFLAESLPRVPANDVYHSLFDTLEGVRKRLNAIEIPTGTDRNITNRHSDMLVTCAEMLSRLDAERKRQYAAREAERIAVEVEQLEIREAQERSRTEQDARIAEQRRADQLRAQEQSAKLAADRDRLAEVRRRVEANAVPALGPGPGGLPPIVIPIGSAVSPTPSSIEPRVFDPPTPPPIPPNVQRSASDLEWSSNPYIPPASGINPSTFPRTPVAGASGVSPGSGSGSPYSAANSLAPNNAAYNNRPDPILEALAERERQLAELVERERQESEARERELAARQAQLRALEAERVALEQRKADRERERIEREERIRVLEAERAERERRRIESEQAAQALLAQQQALRAPVMGPPVPPREPSPGIATAAASEEAADALLLSQVQTELADQNRIRSSLTPTSQHTQALTWIQRSQELFLPGPRAHRNRAIELLKDAGFSWLSHLAQAQPPHFPAVLFLARAYTEDGDPKSALAVLNIGAERGHPECCERAAVLWEKGEGVRPDSDRAKEIRSWKGMGSPEFRKKSGGQAGKVESGVGWWKRK